MTITITAQDDDYPEDHETSTIWDDYLLVCAGSTQRVHTSVYNASDGSQTHVITVRGVRRAPAAPDA